MWVDHAEVEFAGDQEDDGLDGGQSREAACAALGGLEQAIDGFQKAVSLARLRPGDDAFHVTTHEGGNLLHGFDFRAHDTGAPVLERGAHDVDLLAIEDLAQLLLVDPGSGGALDGELGNQGVQVGGGFGFEAGGVLEQRPAQALERLDPPRRAHGHGVSALAGAEGLPRGRARALKPVRLPACTVGSTI